jgi:2-keto-4-pentenoate hydratase/2-oxohepta-3-ene-1,7-dioic acid hydratase in catechol pathway
MRLLTFIHDDAPRLGALIDGDRVVDLAAAHNARAGQPLAWLAMRDLIAAGPEAISELAADLSRVDLAAFSRPLAEVKLAAPVQPSKICAIGLNYLDHVLEGGRKPPERPLLFAKLPTSLIGPGDEITWEPALTDKVDYEAELAVVIGRPARHVKAADAYAYVFGYTCADDISARDLQDTDGQWVRAKSLDTFCPLGPWIVTRDEVPDPHGLPISCEVNGETLQQSNTDQLIFRVPVLIEFLSRAFTLLPGDVILTGTPPGVGHFRKPPRYLGDGDRVTVTIEGIGTLKNVCRTVPAVPAER